MTIQHLRSSTANKRPTPAVMSDGQLAVNTNTASPGLFFKDSAGALIKVGPVHVGTTAPNASPASGGETGNTVGEQWLDTAGGTYVFKVWDGSAWRSESGTFVDVNGDVMTGALGIIAGSAGSPGLYFSGDTNTGLYSPGADQVAISTGGSGRLFINSSGQVGIGTTANANLSLPNNANINFAGPVSYYDTNSAYSSAADRYIVNGAAARYIQNAGTHVWQYAASGTAGNAISFNEGMRLDSSGRLGVGTSSASTNVEINAALDTGASLGLNEGQLSIGREANSGGAIRIGYDTTNNFGFISPGRVGVSWDNLVLNAGGGRVGIGTTSPSELLSIGSSSGDAYTSIRCNSGSAYKAGVKFGVTGFGDYGGIEWNDNGDALKLYTSSSGPITFENNGERARIDSSGRLLVGTSSASGNALLQVAGGIRQGTLGGKPDAAGVPAVGETRIYNFSLAAANTWEDVLTPATDGNAFYVIHFRIGVSDRTNSFGFAQLYYSTSAQLILISGSASNIRVSANVLQLNGTGFSTYGLATAMHVTRIY